MNNPARHPLDLDPVLFTDAAIPPAARRLNRGIVAVLTEAPDMWSRPVAAVRKARLEGKGTFPLLPPDPDARDIEIEGPRGSIRLRTIRPKTRPERGTFLHIHGGGWVMGTPDEGDQRLRRHAEATGLASVSVDYRLAPEYPYPAGPDDCEAAALWLLSEASGFDRDFLAIGGESAGAHLAVVTLLRLRDRHGVSPFRAANLVAGCYDLGGTPSVRNWGDEKLVLNTRDVMNFADNYLQQNEDRRDPDVSPLYASLDGLPPALFSCGTKDLLLDDTLMMATRWHTAGLGVEMGIFPGGCHVFQNFPDEENSRASLAQMETFLNARIDEAGL